MSADSMLLANQLAEPKSTQGLFELPCGYLGADGKLVTEVALREIRGHEEDMLASKTVPDWMKLGELITGCTTRIGSITDRGQIAMAVKQLPAGDRAFLLFAIRRVSMGDILPFRSKCPTDKEECGAESLFQVDLKDLEIKRMADPTKRAGYDGVLPSGSTIRYRILTGVDEEEIAKQQKSKDDTLSLQLLIRTELLNGKPPSLEDFKELSMRDRDYIRSELFDAIDGGVETDIEVTCPKCGVDFVHEVAVGEKGFFFPSQVLKKSKTRSTR